jgi:hypothetical protein
VVVEEANEEAKACIKANRGKSAVLRLVQPQPALEVVDLEQPMIAKEEEVGMPQLLLSPPLSPPPLH